MIYELGNIDRYGIAVNGTVLENASFFSVKLKELIDENKLYNAILIALNNHPLFKTKVIYKKKYYLETNNLPILITHSNIIDRPKEFGKTTNDYPWRICYYNCDIYFEWCHVITDGKGALAFLNDIINAYFNFQLDVSNKSLCLGYESLYNKKVKSYGQKKQAKGFSIKNFPIIKNGFKCQSHIVSIKTEDLLKISKKNDSTPAAIIVPLICKAIRSRIPQQVKNKNVKCGIAIDCRKPTAINTSHNFILVKTITYTDRFDSFSLSTLATIYRSILDLFIEKDNIIASCTSMIKETDFLYNLRPLWLQRLSMKIIAKAVKNNMQNVGFTYLGKVPLKKELYDKIESFGFRTWPDIGHCCVAAIDFNGTLFLDFCENYVDKEVIPSFIKICRNYGLIANIEKEEIFEQASMKVNYEL